MNKYSLVFTTYNDQNEIVPFLESIISQSVKPHEIVMADGGSADKTVDIARNIKDKFNLNMKIITKGRLNVSQGYNVAIKASSCDLIGIVGVGNIYAENHFEELLNCLNQYKVDIAYAPIRGYDSTSYSKLYNRSMLNNTDGNDLLIASNHSALVKRDIFKKTGLFYEGFVYAGEDAEFYNRAKRKGITFHVAKDARVYWKTPENFRQHLKQINAYTIASLQIESGKQLILHYLDCFLFWGVILGTVALSFFNHWSISLCIIIFYLIAMRYKFRRFQLKYAAYKMIPIIITPYYIFKNLKYTKKKYHLQNNQIEML